MVLSAHFTFIVCATKAKKQYPKVEDESKVQFELQKRWMERAVTAP
jgi:hypothetical protein